MKKRSTQKKRSAPAPPARPKADPRRCRFTTTDGRRCQMLRAANHATLCFAHAKQEQELAQSGQDLSQELVSLSGNLNTASDVNQVLRKLFFLFAQRRISRRDAAAFAYIAQLILQTLRGVKNEMQVVLGYDAWQEILATAVGVDEEAETDETEENDETDEADDESDDAEENEEEDQDEQQRNGDSTDHGTDDTEVQEAAANKNSTEPNQGSRPLPQSLAELATMALARHAERHRYSPPVRGST